MGSHTLLLLASLLELTIVKEVESDITTKTATPLSCRLTAK
jgi:hypothetical protein